jgi:ATP-dependent DNA helicase RecG
VGTHALLEDRVDFFDLGLVVVDEQHRFGVEQRDALRAKAGSPPHVLVMTATPIPRTVAMTVFGDLDVSTLSELPGGRSPIQTNVVPGGERPGWLDRVWERVREEVGGGQQAYVVCPRIGDEAGTVESAGQPDPRRRQSRTGAAPTGTSSATEDDAGFTDARGRRARAPRPPLAVLDVAPMLAAGPLAALADRRAPRPGSPLTPRTK